MRHVRREGHIDRTGDGRIALQDSRNGNRACLTRRQDTSSADRCHGTCIGRRGHRPVDITGGQRSIDRRAVNDRMEGGAHLYVINRGDGRGRGVGQYQGTVLPVEGHRHLVRIDDGAVVMRRTDDRAAVVGRSDRTGMQTDRDGVASAHFRPGCRGERRHIDATVIDTAGDRMVLGRQLYRTRIVRTERSSGDIKIMVHILHRDNRGGGTHGEVIPGRLIGGRDGRRAGGLAGHHTHRGDLRHRRIGRGPAHLSVRNGGRRDGGRRVKSYTVKRGRVGERFAHAHCTRSRSKRQGVIIHAHPIHVHLPTVFEVIHPVTEVMDRPRVTFIPFDREVIRRVPAKVTAVNHFAFVLACGLNQDLKIGKLGFHCIDTGRFRRFVLRSGDAGDGSLDILRDVQRSHHGRRTGPGHTLHLLERQKVRGARRGGAAEGKQPSVHIIDLCRLDAGSGPVARKTSRHLGQQTAYGDVTGRRRGADRIGAHPGHRDAKAVDAVTALVIGRDTIDHLSHV